MLLLFDVFDFFLYAQPYCKMIFVGGLACEREPFYILLTKFEKNYLTLVSLL